MNEVPVGQDISLESLVAQLADEFTQRLERGERPAIEDYVQRYPQHAAVIRNLLSSLEFMRLSVPGSSGSEISSSPDIGPATPLGDYRILREVGRGGMGIVYEAEQLSLGRRVALKVLPFAATMDPRQLQRFKNEALAAAHLDHPHLVDVYGVGCERGVHFYAMRYIDGHTLAEIIDQLRVLRGQEGASLPDAVVAVQTRLEPRPPRPDEQTGDYTPQPAEARETAVGMRTGRSSGSARFSRSYFRSVAQLGAEVAEALDHAHQMGVVHRDIKPSNLMLDLRGKVWITDFGLARRDDAARVTVTGDLVGTLRYMSPEQALAKRIPIDHRSDVYSLGVTLYELLTLEPAFAVSDRQELMQQIAFEEPRPPRRLCQEIPSELETIVLKATEKNPLDRYATAQELANDLRRWLEDKPIQARRPSLAQRMRKWARRHRAVVVTAALGLLLALSVVAGSIGWVVGDQAARQAEAERPGEAAFREAERLLARKQYHEAMSEAMRAQVLLAQAGGHPWLGPQVEELLKDLHMLVDLQEIRLDWSAPGKDGDVDNAGTDQRFRDAFRDYGIDVEALPVDVAAARIRERRIKIELVDGLYNWGLAQFYSRKGDGRALFEVASAAHPDEGRRRLRDVVEGRGAGALAELTRLEKIDALPASALVAATLHLLEKKNDLARVVPLLRQAQQRQPDDFWLNHCLALALGRMQPPQLDEAITFCRVAVALQPKSPSVHYNLGTVLFRKGRLDEAVTELRKAIDLKPNYASAYVNLGIVLAKQKKLVKAVANFHKAIKLKPDYAQAYSNLGTALIGRGLADQAIVALKKALHFEPGDAQTHATLGEALMDRQRMDEAIAELHEAIRLNKDNAGAHINLGIALFRKGRVDEAVVHFREAIRIEPDNAVAQRSLGVALRKQNRPDEAILALKEAIRLKPDFGEAHYNLGNALADKGQLDEAILALKEAIRLKPDYGSAHYNLGRILKDKGRLDEARVEYLETIRLWPDFPDAHCNLGRMLQEQGRFTEALAYLRRGHELGSKRPGWPYVSDSARWVQQCERLAQLDKKLPAILSGKEQAGGPIEQVHYAELCLQNYKRLYASAARLYQQALAARPSLAADPRTEVRYYAACAAALAGCGQGNDASKLDEAERGRWRRQALDWLRADLALWTKQADSPAPQVRALVRKALTNWQKETDLAGVHDKESLLKLPQAEREAWQTLWQDVDKTLTRASRPVPARPSAPGQSP
jgi:tetratricopeptide (TPR) repeat protein